MTLHAGRDQFGAHPDALALICAHLESGIRPRPTMPLSQWLGENITLVDGPLAGEPWSASGAPYLVEPADCLSDDHPCNVVVIRKSQQSGASILALAWCLFIADREPANMLYAIPGLDALRELNSAKLQPLIEAWQKRIKRSVIVPQTSRSATGSTTYEKVFSGGRLFLGNANSVMDLSSKTIKKGVEDEVSKWEQIPGYGDPEKLFFGRFTAFRRTREYKILKISTPEVDTGDDSGETEGHCRIDLAFKGTDQRFWNCVCPECGNLFVHDFTRLRIDADHPHKTAYECWCGHMISDSERIGAIDEGRWVPSVEEPGREPGFHIDAFISKMMSYEAIAEDSLEAKTEIDRKAFWNLDLGLPYKYRGDAPDHVRLMERREVYPENHVPAEGLLLAAGADVQHNGIWVEVVAFARDRQSWTVTRRFVEGDTTDPDKGAWTQLAEIYDERFPDAFGEMRIIDAMAVDAGDGGRANQVYAWTRSRARAFAIKGVPGWTAPAVGTPTKVSINLKGKKIKGGAMLWPLGTWSLKAEFYANLRKKGRTSGAEEDPPGYCHFGDWLDEPYFKQITSEFLDSATVRGRTVKVWKELGPNHLLDARVYAMAMGEYLGLTRMNDDDWASLARLRGAPEEVKNPDMLAPDSVKLAARPALIGNKPKRKRRRVLSRGV